MRGRGRGRGRRPIIPVSERSMLQSGKFYKECRSFFAIGSSAVGVEFHSDIRPSSRGDARMELLLTATARVHPHAQTQSDDETDKESERERERGGKGQ